MDLIWIVNLGARILLLGRFTWTGQWREWPALTSLLAISISKTVISMYVKANLSATFYGGTWIVLTAILIGVTIFASLEAFRKQCEEFPHAERNGRKLLLGVTAVAILLASVSLFTDARTAIQTSPAFALLIGMTIAQRYVSTALAIGLLSVWLFFRPYPSDRQKYVTLNIRFLALWFTLVAIGFWLYNIGDKQLRAQADRIMLSADALCLTVWALLLRRMPAPVQRNLEASPELIQLQREHDANLDRARKLARRLKDEK